MGENFIEAGARKMWKTLYLVENGLDGRYMWGI